MVLSLAHVEGMLGHTLARMFFIASFANVLLLGVKLIPLSSVA